MPSLRAQIWDVEAILPERRLAWLFITPSLLILGVVIGGAIAYALFVSFHKLAVAGGSVRYDFVGLSNYLRLLEDQRLRQTLGQTLLYTLVRVGAVMVIGTALALLLNQPIAGVSILKRLFLVPWALSFVANAVVWGWIYNGSYGAANAILMKLRLIQDYHAWLADPKVALIAIVFADVWKSVPFAALMLLAALQGVPRDIQDAAKVDGANAWRRFLHVILPWLSPVILVLLVVETMWALKTFDLIWVLTKGGPLDRTMVLNVYAYSQTFQFFNFGYGSAVAYLVMALMLTLTILYVIALRRFGD